MTRRSVFVLLASLCLGMRLGGVAQAPAGAVDLQTALRALASRASGTLGVSVLHVESGESSAVHGHEWFPMMSVYKLPMVIHALRQTEQGALAAPRPSRPPCARSV